MFTPFFRMTGEVNIEGKTYLSKEGISPRTVERKYKIKVNVLKS